MKIKIGTDMRKRAVSGGLLKIQPKLFSGFKTTKSNLENWSLDLEINEEQ